MGEVIVPFHRFSVENEDTIAEDVANILKSGNVAKGSYIKELEKYFEKHHNAFAISCANCTSGLAIAIKSLSVYESIISLPAFTWYSTLYAAESNNANVYFEDVKLDSWLSEERNVSCDIRIGVDTFGNQFNSDYIGCKYLIVDAAHGFGLPELGQRGYLEVVSLSFTKLVSGMQGGVILTKDRSLANECIKLVNNYSKLTEINARVALESIKHFRNNQGLRFGIIDSYRKYLSDNIEYTEQSIPECSNQSVYAIVLKDKETRDKIANAFYKYGIEVKIYYEPLIKGLPNTDYIYNRIIALPVYKGMENKVGFICEVIKRAVE